MTKSNLTKFRGIVKWFDTTKNYGFITSVQKISSDKNIILENVEHKDSEKDAIDEWEKNSQFDMNSNSNSKDIFCHHTSILVGNASLEQEDTNSYQRSSSYNNENEQRHRATKKLQKDDTVEFVIRYAKTIENEKRLQAMDIITLSEEEKNI
ncbi:hypothetical protein [Candidatus Phytoplasma oryzae]|nr:cold shock domain-containing protein [Candidatus Phytoplasma oryzae]